MWPVKIPGGLLTLAILGVALAQQVPPAPAGELRRMRLHGVVSSGIFKSVNRNDAVAAVKALFDIVGKQKGFLLDSKVDVVDGVAEIRRRLQGGSVDLLILDLADYMQLEGSGLIKPTLVGTLKVGAEALYSYILMVNQSSTAGTIADLRGKKVAVFSRNASNAGLAWVEILLGKQKLGRGESFFASFQETSKPQACILPLFFGSVDACVVDEVNLEMLKEMNPQLGKLRMLARSSPLIESVIATPVERHPYLDELLEAILSLHQDPRGRQLLMVFKTTQLIRVRPGDLEAAHKFWGEYNRLIVSSPQQAAGPGQAPAPAALRFPPDRGKEKD